MKIKLYYLSDTEKNKFMFLTLNNLLNSETVTRNPNLFIDCDQIVFRFIYSGVKPLIHKSELRTYTKVVPFNENSSFRFVVL